MIYGDLQFFDIILFAGIAAFLVFRLRSVLGKRSGGEKNIAQTKTQNDNNHKTNEVKNIPQLQENYSKLIKAYEVFNDFDHKNFLDGAKVAFETIINAFNKGDKKTLKKLLTQEVYNSFENAIDNKKNNPEYQFYSLVINKVENVILENNIIKISIEFVSEQFKNNDENTVVKKQDLWTFQKSLNSTNPNWLLSAT